MSLNNETLQDFLFKKKCIPHLTSDLLAILRYLVYGFAFVSHDLLPINWSKYEGAFISEVRFNKVKKKGAFWSINHHLQGSVNQFWQESKFLQTTSSSMAFFLQ